MAPLNLLQLIRRAARQAATQVGRTVSNIHGGAAVQAERSDLTVVSSWLRLTTRGDRLLTATDFYRLVLGGGNLSPDLIEADAGVATVAEPDLVVQLYRGAITAGQAVQWPLTVTLAGPQSEAAVYIDGVLERRGTSKIAISRHLDAGDHLIEIVVFSPSVTIETPKDVLIDGSRDVLNAPAIDSLTTDYVDLQSGQSQITISWHADPRVGGWRVLRRQPVLLGTVAAVGTPDRAGQYGLSISGNVVASLPVGTDLLIGGELAGTVLQAFYDGSTTTNVTLRLPPDRGATSTLWPTGQAYATSWTELGRVRRSVGDGLQVFTDATVSTGQAYQYALQAFSVFDDSTLGPLSAVKQSRAGDNTPPAAITITNKDVPITGYPKVIDKKVTVKFRTPNDPDYAGVRVYYRGTVLTGTVTGGSGSSIDTSLSPIVANQYVGFTFYPTNGPAGGLDRAITSNNGTGSFTLDSAYDSFATPAIGNTVSVYKEVAVCTDYGTPNTDDELQFEQLGYGEYHFRTFDLAGNEQADEDAVVWVYDGSDDQTIIPNQPPVIYIEQLSPAEQAAFSGYTDNTKFVLYQIKGSDPVDGTTNVTLYYQKRGAGSPTTMPASTSAVAGTVDNPAGTRSRYIAVSRDSDETFIEVWCTDAQAFESDHLTVKCDFDLTPEIVSCETSYNIGGSSVNVAVVVDDDTRMLKWWVDVPAAGEGSSASPITIDTTTQKANFFTVALADGQRKRLTVEPWSATSGFAGKQVVRDLSRAPRTSVVFESRDESGNVSSSRVRATLVITPKLTTSAQRTVTSSGNTNGGFTDNGSPGWTTNQFAFDEGQLKYYFVEFTSGAFKGQVRQITANTSNTISFSPALTGAPNAADYRIWAGGTIVRVDPEVADRYVVPSVDNPVTSSRTYFDRQGDQPTNFQYRSVTAGAPPEPMHSVAVDADTIPYIDSLTVNEGSPGVVTATVAGFDDDCKYWILYARKGSWPTLTGSAPVRTGSTNKWNVDPTYMMWEDTPANGTAPSRGCGTGTWYFVAVPYNSYGDDGQYRSQQLSVVGASPGLTNVNITTPSNTTNRVNWSTLNITCPDAGKTVKIWVSKDGGSETSLTTTALACDHQYDDTTIGTRVSDPSQGTFHTLSYRVELWSGGSLIAGPYTVSRSDYFQGTSITLSTVTASIAQGGTADTSGLPNTCTSQHINLVQWTTSASNDTEYKVEVWCQKDRSGSYDQLVASNIPPSQGSVYHYEDYVFAATGAGSSTRYWQYQVKLIRKSDNSVVSTMNSSELNQVCKTCSL